MGFSFLVLWIRLFYDLGYVRFINLGWDYMIIINLGLDESERV